MDTGRGLPGGYAGKGMTGRGKGRVFSTRELTRTYTRQTRTAAAGIPYKYDGECGNNFYNRLFL